MIALTLKSARLVRHLAIVAVCGMASACTSVGHKIGMTKCAPVYGNWCGEDYPLKGFNPRPIDNWDRACRDHDKCYESGASKSECDSRLVSQLERLSHRQLAPQRIHNAHSFFSSYGYKEGWFQFADEAWGLHANCEGGDGRAAEFYCVLNAWNSCPLVSTAGPGRAGMLCNCAGFPGRIVER